MANSRLIRHLHKFSCIFDSGFPSVNYLFVFACLEAHLKIIKGALKIFPRAQRGTRENHREFSVRLPISQSLADATAVMFAAFDLSSDASWFWIIT